MSKIDYFDSEALQQGVKEKTVRGGLVVGGTQVLSVALGLLAIPILARLLQPEDYGLLALVAVVTGLASLFVDAGLPLVTIQRKEITHQQVSNLFWVASALGVAAMLFTAACAPVLAWFYEDLRLLPVALALSLTFFFNGLAQQPTALMKRAMRFESLAIATLCGAVAHQSIAIAWAWWRQGSPDAYWALVFGPLSAAPVRLLIIWALCGWTPSFYKRGSGVREMLSFGAYLTGSSLVNTLATHADAAVLGTMVGMGQLGAFDRAKQLLIYPQRAINLPLSGVAITALSRSVDNPSTYRALYSGAITLSTMLSLPLAAVSMAAPDWCVRVAFGPGWQEAADILFLLGPAVVLLPYCVCVSWLFTSQGRAKELLTWRALDSLLRLTLTVVGATLFGALGVAASITLRQVIAAPAYYHVISRKGAFRFSVFLRLVIATLVATFVATAAAYALRMWATDLESPLIGLLVIGAAAAIVGGVTLLAFPFQREPIVKAARIIFSKR